MLEAVSSSSYGEVHRPASPVSHIYPLVPQFPSSNLLVSVGTYQGPLETGRADVVERLEMV